MQGGLREPRSLILPVELRLRESIGPAPRDQPRWAASPESCILTSGAAAVFRFTAKAGPRAAAPADGSRVPFRRTPPWTCRGATFLSCLPAGAVLTALPRRRGGRGPAPRLPDQRLAPQARRLPELPRRAAAR
ncbi:MAG: hypothetical protein M0C28_37325 [Candidatus Moduliflexus flocculans]|nr:hypothetical protein [Candidatus Moduliflexus flocculans]